MINCDGDVETKCGKYDHDSFENEEYDHDSFEN